jgi:hypothetical protein
MKLCLLIFTVTLHLLCLSQKPNSGTYIFKYCDFEYNNCYGTCKVIIKNDSIIIYATKKLAQRRTFTKEGDIIDQGIILKHQSGKWIVGKTQSDIHAKQIGAEGPAILDFKKKQYWTF